MTKMEVTWHEILIMIVYKAIILIGIVLVVKLLSMYMGYVISLIYKCQTNILSIIAGQIRY